MSLHPLSSVILFSVSVAVSCMCELLCLHPGAVDPGHLGREGQREDVSDGVGTEKAGRCVCCDVSRWALSVCGSPGKLFHTLLSFVWLIN